MTEAADDRFTMGLKYICAARRIDGAGSDDETRQALARLAVVYRERAFALMTETAPAQ